MASIQNVELIDDVRKDALLLMKSRPNIDYGEAFELARQNLIGEGKITEFTSKPFTVDIELDNDKSDLFTDGSHYYVQYAKDNFADILNPDEFTIDQLKAYVVAHRMGVDLKLLVDKNYNAEQINYLAVLLASGKSIDKYRNNYTFDPKEEFVKIADMSEEDLVV